MKEKKFYMAREEYQEVYYGSFVPQPVAFDEIKRLYVEWGMNEKMTFDEFIETWYETDEYVTTYKDYEKTYIGCSDIAALILAGGGENNTHPVYLKFGEDGAYSAYIVGADCPIPAHYALKHIFKKWLKIYDDDGKTIDIKSDVIKVYQAGSFGCIIQKS